jgi:hypothetical protein
VERTYIPASKMYSPDAAIILIGTRADRRLKTTSLLPTTPMEFNVGLEVAKKHKCLMYLEATDKGIPDLESTILQALIYNEVIKANIPVEQRTGLCLLQ